MANVPPTAGQRARNILLAHVAHPEARKALDYLIAECDGTAQNARDALDALNATNRRLNQQSRTINQHIHDKLVMAKQIREFEQITVALRSELDALRNAPAAPTKVEISLSPDMLAVLKQLKGLKGLP